MAYFKYMPTTYYKGDYSGQFIRGTDITVRARILEFIENAAGSVVDYNIRDGERPEHLAHRVYGNPEYHWVNLLYNEIHDPYFEWPMSSKELETLVEKKYEGRTYFVDLKKAMAQYTDFYFEEGTATVKGVLTATITRWDSNMYKLVVNSDSPGTSSSIEGSQIVQTRADGKTVSATILRVVDDNRYAAHHFINQDTNEIVDHHLVNADPYVVQDLGYANIGTTVSSLSILERYTGYIDNSTNSYVSGVEVINLDEKTVSLVTNYDYEISINEAKRKIKVMRPEYVDFVVKDLQKVFIGG